ncbi:hypothetical protein CAUPRSCDRAFT_10593 [Caulochytrium protostelioides]|nr:hypothetical protein CAUPRSCDRAFT_10593 [Caulochytrium protostelioides]
MQDEEDPDALFTTRHHVVVSVNRDPYMRALIAQNAQLTVPSAGPSAFATVTPDCGQPVTLDRQYRADLVELWSRRRQYVRDLMSVFRLRKVQRRSGGAASLDGRRRNTVSGGTPVGGQRPVEYRIVNVGFGLPTPSMGSGTREKLNAGLGHIIQLVQLLADGLAVTLPFPLTFRGKASYVEALFASSSLSSGEPAFTPTKNASGHPGVASTETTAAAGTVKSNDNDANGGSTEGEGETATRDRDRDRDHDSHDGRDAPIASRALPLNLTANPSHSASHDLAVMAIAMVNYDIAYLNHMVGVTIRPARTIHTLENIATCCQTVSNIAYRLQHAAPPTAPAPDSPNDPRRLAQVLAETGRPPPMDAAAVAAGIARDPELLRRMPFRLNFRKVVDVHLDPERHAAADLDLDVDTEARPSEATAAGAATGGTPTPAVTMTPTAAQRGVPSDSQFSSGDELDVTDVMDDLAAQRDAAGMDGGSAAASPAYAMRLTQMWSTASNLVAHAAQSSAVVSHAVTAASQAAKVAQHASRARLLRDGASGLSAVAAATAAGALSSAGLNLSRSLGIGGSHDDSSGSGGGRDGLRARGRAKSLFDFGSPSIAQNGAGDAYGLDSERLFWLALAAAQDADSDDAAEAALAWRLSDAETWSRGSDEDDEDDAVDVDVDVAALRDAEATDHPVVSGAAALPSRRFAATPRSDGRRVAAAAAAPSESPSPVVDPLAMAAATAAHPIQIAHPAAGSDRGFLSRRATPLDAATAQTPDPQASARAGTGAASGSTRRGPRTAAPAPEPPSTVPTPMSGASSSRSHPDEWDLI